MPHVFSNERLIKINTSMIFSRGNKSKETIDFQFCNIVQTQGTFPNSQKKGVRILTWDYYKFTSLISR
jgi:hypothetical protein